MKLNTRETINWIIYGAIFALTFYAASKVFGQPRYVVPFPEKLSLASIDSLSQYVGKTEATGNNDGAWVADILRGVDINFPAPYCAAGTVQRFDKVRGALPLPIARSPLALGIWNDAKKRGKLSSFGVVRKGDVVIYRHAGTTAGHAVAAVTSVKPPFFADIEFNTSSGNSGNQRDGGGCYRRVRKYGNLGTLQLKGAIGFK